MSARYHFAQKRRRMPWRVWLLIVTCIVLVAGGAAAVQRTYSSNLFPVSNSTEKHYITILSGASLSQIASQLKNAGLIRSSQAFEWYVSAHNYRDKLQAGTYSFAPDQGTAAIAETIAHGKVAADLMTIIPGARLDQVRRALIDAGFKPDTVDAALQADQYRSAYPALADNPPAANLEGFLYPDSYQKTADTDPREIIRESLTAMQQHLTVDIRNGFAAHGLSVYQGVTLASLVEQEAPSQQDRDQVAQVFIKRLQTNMALGSDVSANYGAIKDGVASTVARNVAHDSPYNTRLHKGLPPGPISTVSDGSLRAVAYPASTDWLYFVRGDDGAVHFAKTLDEHQANINQYCHDLCNQTN